MVVQFNEEVEEIPNSAGFTNHEIDGFWPDENDSDASENIVASDVDSPNQYPQPSYGNESMSP
jgi:hypothetical protein